MEDKCYYCSRNFYCNKNVVSIRKTGQKSYENIFNFIEAKNNDEMCPYNKATFSSELVEKLLKIYCPKTDWYMIRLWGVELHFLSVKS